ncbi:MAG: hypothetical protein JSS32_04000 [Verrucomicrobia bacterium]|nr:hypothetical protein [Verrucomicrobiota bacterium]
MKLIGNVSNRVLDFVETRVPVLGTFASVARMVAGVSQLGLNAIKVVVSNDKASYRDMAMGAEHFSHGLSQTFSTPALNYFKNKDKILPVEKDHPYAHLRNTSDKAWDAYHESMKFLDEPVTLREYFTDDGCLKISIQN